MKKLCAQDLNSSGGGLVANSCPYDPVDCSLQAPLSMRFSRPEYWSGLPFSSPGDLPDPEIEPRSPALQTGSFFLLKKIYIFFNLRIIAL